MIDYRKRCVLDGDGFQVVRYGVSAEEANNGGRDHAWWRDEAAPYRELSTGPRVRRPGCAIETEYRYNKHFFNKRIMTDEERSESQARSQEQARIAALQTYSYAGGLGASNGAGGASGAAEAAAGAGRARSGDQGGEGEVE